MQEIAVVIVLLAALCYGGWRIYKVFLSTGDPCYGKSTETSPKEEKSRLLAQKVV